jgi:ribosomal protein S18 acetylase RimI-like enzyme
MSGGAWLSEGIPMQDLVLREATDADIPMIAALVRTAFEEYRGRLDPPSGAHRETDEKVRRMMSSTAVALALTAGEPCGCVFYEQTADQLSFFRLAVLPAYRRHGIGQALIAYVENRARELNVQVVRLGVRIALPRLRAFYERPGYHYVESRNHDGYALPTYDILEKTLHLMNHSEGK